MKVIQKTEHLLKLSNQQEKSSIMVVAPAIIYIAFGTLFSAIPLLITLGITIFSGVERLSCKKIERASASCELTTSSLMGLVKGRLISIERVQEAKVEIVNSTDSDGHLTSLENVFLVTNKGNVHLPNQTGNDAKLFNKYIQTAVGGLVIEKDNRLSNLGTLSFISLFLLIGFGCIYSGLSSLIVETYIFDKNANTLIIQKTWIKVNKVSQRSFGEIYEVELSEVEVKGTEGSNDYKLYEVRLLMNRGDRVSLAERLNWRERISLGHSTSQKEQQKMADLIRGYLDGRSPSDAL
jgi:hypothetical protein